MSETKDKGIITTEFRTSFVNVFKARAGFQGREPGFSIQMLFEKEDKEALREFKKYVKAKIVEKWGDTKGNDKAFLKKLKLPFKSGDLKTLESHKGKIVVEARTKLKPGVVKVNGKGELIDITEEGEFYSGCYARARVTCKAFEATDPNTKAILARGVTVYLQSVVKTKDGEPFGQKRNAQDDFSEIEFEPNENETADGDEDLPDADEDLDDEDF